MKLSTDIDSSQISPDGPMASFDGGLTYSTNFRYKELQKYYSKTYLMRSGKLYDGDNKLISTTGGMSVGTLSGTDAPTYSTAPFAVAKELVTTKIIHENLELQTFPEAGHYYNEGPAFTKSDSYSTGESSSTSIVTVRFNLFDDANTISIINSAGITVATFTGSGEGVLETPLSSNEAFRVVVNANFEGSNSDAWSYTVSVQNTKAVEKVIESE